MLVYYIQFMNVFGVGGKVLGLVENGIIKDVSEKSDIIQRSRAERPARSYSILE